MKARVRKKTEETAGKMAEKRRFLISEIQAEIMPH
jgi:hypothetical protein